MQIHCIDKQKADQLESDVFVSHAILSAMDLFCPCSFANETAPYYFFKTEKYILPNVFEPVQLKLMGSKTTRNTADFHMDSKTSFTLQIGVKLWI